MAANNLDHFLPRRCVKKYASGIFLASVLLLLHPNRINAGRSDFYICQKRAMPFFDKLKKKSGAAAPDFFLLDRAYSSSISSSLALTGWPSFTRTDLTVPAVRAVMAVSIFMASMMIST